MKAQFVLALLVLPNLAFGSQVFEISGDNIIRNSSGDPITVAQPGGTRIGTRKNARLYAPSTVQKDLTALPMIVVLHGYAGPINIFGKTYSVGQATQDFYLKFSDLVDEKNILVLVPEGLTSTNGKQYWNATDFCCDGAEMAEKTGVDDVTYLTQLVAEVRSTDFMFRHGMRAGPVFLFGHSNGGFMANRLLCDTHGIFDGMVSLAGTNFKDLAQCRPSQSFPVLLIHSLDDPVILYQGSPYYSSVKENAEFWAVNNSCDVQKPTSVSLDLLDWFLKPGEDTDATRYLYCQDPVEVWSISNTIARPLVHSPHRPGFKETFKYMILDWLLTNKR